MVTLGLANRYFEHAGGMTNLNLAAEHELSPALGQDHAAAWADMRATRLAPFLPAEFQRVEARTRTRF